MSLPEFLISPHPQAPLFDVENPNELLRFAVDEIRNPTESVREILRQVGFVNLWFFGKFICGYSGPFDKWNAASHLEMANFRQSVCMRPGARAAMFLPRRTFKTSILTEAGTAYEVLRNPNIRARITHKIAEKAYAFRQTVRNVFEKNELFKWLYPEYLTKTSAADFVLLNRTKQFREPTVDSGGVGGASAGYHYDLHDVDDPHDVNELGANYVGGAEFESDKKWFWANEHTLLVDTSSRVLLATTRYAEDDIGGDVAKKACRWEGYLDPDWTPNPTGKWVVYYRSVLEEVDGKTVNVFPEAYTEADLEDIQANDPWAYWTQIVNSTKRSGIAEFAMYQPLCFEMLWDAKKGLLVALKSGEPKAVKSFNVVQAMDPAGMDSEKGAARTSRTALVVVGMDADGGVWVFDAKAARIGFLEMLEIAWGNKDRFGGLWKTLVETQGAFKVLGPIAKDFERRKNQGLPPEDWKFLNLDFTTATINKYVRIRAALQPLLDSRSLFINEACKQIVMGELHAFGEGAKVDVLDALATGVRGLKRPRSEEEKQFYAMAEWAAEDGRSQLVGY